LKNGVWNPYEIRAEDSERLLLWKGVKEMEKLAYNMKEVAEVLGISKSLAYEMAKKGELPIIRMGNRILVPIKRLEEMFDVTE